MNHHDKHLLITEYKRTTLERDVDWSINIGLPLAALWDLAQEFTDTFEGRTEIFFVLFKEMLRRGHLKLQRDGQLIEHSPEEWEAIFREVWPEYEEEPNPLPGYAPFTIGMWLTVDAPAYAVWVDPDDGSLYWAG